MANLPGGKTGLILDVEFLSKLGHGSFGHVYKARDLENRTAVDVAKMGEGEKGLQRVKQEVYKGIVTTKKNGIMWIVMEILEGGDLEDIIIEHQRSKQPIRENDIWLYFSQIVEGLRQCHLPDTRGGSNPDGRVVIHRDLKDANLFLDKQRNILKIGDFGLARHLAEEEWVDSYAGTPEYMAPEMLEDATIDREYGETVDIHAIGVILYRMCSLEYPFEGRNLKDKIKNIRSAPAPAIPSHYSRELKRLCDALLSRNPKILPSLDRLMEHPGVKLGSAMVRLNEQQTRIKTLTSDVITMDAIISQNDESCRELQSKFTAMSTNLAKKVSENRINRSVLLAEIESLQGHMQTEREAHLARSAELDLRENVMRLRQAESEKERHLVSFRRAQVEQDRAAIQPQQIAVEEKQVQQQQLQHRLDAQAKDLATRINKYESTVPGVSGGTGLSFNVALPRAAEKSTARQPIRTGASSTAPVQNPRINASRAAAEPRVTSGVPPSGPVNPAQQSVAPAKPVQRGNQVVRTEARNEGLKRKAAPCDSPSTSKRKIRSAPAFEKKERVPSSFATSAPSKWSDEALTKNAGRVGMTKLSTAAPINTVKKEPTLVGSSTNNREKRRPDASVPSTDLEAPESRASFAHGVGLCLEQTSYLSPTTASAWRQHQQHRSNIKHVGDSSSSTVSIASSA
ncbi:hypothetical protein QFC20_007569 [Naganishia adeliensis]|uniref:Uncharacterized protein n=1 Tax=Naganishia adeliensis TaxID=92952 RepID=A0ACC2UYG1_9TREE|nr:hypothetical protein QFC20_007569 [Naganishia adeliensis]